MQINSISPISIRSFVSIETNQIPDFDPEEDMAAERFDQSKAEPSKETFKYTPSKQTAPQAGTIAKFRIGQDKYSRGKEKENDRFTYFTLIEAILIYHVIYSNLPKGTLSFSFGTKDLNQKARMIEQHFQICKGESILYKYQLIYDMTKSLFSIYEWDLTRPTNTANLKKVGEVDFHLVGRYNSVEDAVGYIYDAPISLDPVWDRKTPNKIKYQSLKIGHRRLDLTSPTKGSSQGHWSFKGAEQPLPFYMMFDSHETKPDHILTKKHVQIGRTKLDLELKFIDDSFPEPYDGDGVITVS